MSHNEVKNGFLYKIQKNKKALKIGFGYKNIAEKIYSERTSTMPYFYFVKKRCNFNFKLEIGNVGVVA